MNDYLERIIANSIARYNGNHQDRRPMAVAIAEDVRKCIPAGEWEKPRVKFLSDNCSYSCSLHGALPHRIGRGVTVESAYKDWMYRMFRFGRGD